MIWWWIAYLISAVVAYGAAVAALDGERGAAFFISLSGPLGLIFILVIFLQEKKFFGFRFW